VLPKLDVLDEYRTNPLFNSAERAALDYATQLTENKRVSPDTFAVAIAALLGAADLRDRLAHLLMPPDEHL
jgi:alkylhydroperoxidase family enzyme